MCRRTVSTQNCIITVMISIAKGNTYNHGVGVYLAKGNTYMELGFTLLVIVADESY